MIVYGKGCGDIVKLGIKPKKEYRFCDIATSHQGKGTTFTVDLWMS